MSLIGGSNALVSRRGSCGWSIWQEIGFLGGLAVRGGRYSVASHRA